MKNKTRTDLCVDALTHVDATVTDADTSIPMVDVHRNRVTKPVPEHGVPVRHDMEAPFSPTVGLGHQKKTFIISVFPPLSWT